MRRKGQAPGQSLAHQYPRRSLPDLPRYVPRCDKQFGSNRVACEYKWARSMSGHQLSGMLQVGCPSVGISEHVRMKVVDEAGH
jgi:hypothetical protein